MSDKEFDAIGETQRALMREIAKADKGIIIIQRIKTTSHENSKN